jgi:lysophospholipase L1-like esterase
MDEGLKIVTIIGDSLSMVRPDCGLCIKNLYPYKLQERLGGNYYVVVRNRRANNTNIQCEYQNLHDDVLYNDSRYMVFHLGIVDCAPRLITFPERQFFKVLGINWRDNLYIRFKSRYRRFFTKHHQFQRVSREQFHRNFSTLINLIKQHTSVVKVFIINIADTNEYNKYRSYNYERNIYDYNEIISDVINKHNDICSLIDMYSESIMHREIMLDDGMHINEKGHDFIAKVLYDKIQQSGQEYEIKRVRTKINV